MIDHNIFLHLAPLSETIVFMCNYKSVIFLLHLKATFIKLVIICGHKFLFFPQLIFECFSQR